jgi:hypothetical protein
MIYALVVLFIIFATVVPILMVRWSEGKWPFK